VGMYNKWFAFARGEGTFTAAVWCYRRVDVTKRGKKIKIVSMSKNDTVFYEVYWGDGLRAERYRDIWF